MTLISTKWFIWFSKVLNHFYTREFSSIKSFLSIQLLNELWYPFYVTFSILNPSWFVFRSSFSKNINLLRLRWSFNIRHLSSLRSLISYSHRKKNLTAIITKNLFRPIWNISFSKNAFIFWYSSMIKSFRFRIFIIKFFNRVQIHRGPKKAPYFFFHPKVLFYNFFLYFSGGVDSRHARFFWHQYGSNWRIYYAAVNKRWGVLYQKISSSDTAVIQERFWQEQCTWQKNKSTFSSQISGDRKCSRCSTKATAVDIVQTFKSNRPGSFLILWLMSLQNVSRPAIFRSVCLCKIWIL